MSRAVNPYQPVAAPDTDLDTALWDADAPLEASVELTDQKIRHFESHYLLHWHPIKILVASLTMIAMSVVVMFYSMRLGIWISLGSVAFCLLFSAIVYSMIVAKSKKRLRKRLIEHGIVGGNTMTVRSELDYLVLLASRGTYRWPNKQVVLFAARGGILLCPEPLLFLFVPKQCEFSHGGFKEFLERTNQRLNRQSD